MIIASAVDEGFVPHYVTMLHSARSNNPGALFRLVDCGISVATAQKLRQFGGTNFELVPIDNALLSGVPVTQRYSKAAYARLFYPLLFPRDEKILHLDADMLILGDLRKLWNIELGHNLVAGVRDSDRWMPLPDFINTGVLLMNLKAWRASKFTDACLEYVRTKNPKSADQTAINALGQGSILIVDTHWNYCTHRTADTIPLELPRVLHYTSFWKPWRFRDAPFAELYRYHRNQTPWPITEHTPVYRPWWRAIFFLLLMRPKYWTWLRGLLRQKRSIAGYLQTLEQG